MTNPILGLRTVIYTVNNIEQAKEWYSKVFETVPYFNEPYYVGFNVAGYELGLQPKSDSDTAKPESVVAYWGVADIEAAYKRMLSLGATENSKPSNVGGDIMVATVKDLWGNNIGLIYNPEFKLS